MCYLIVGQRVHMHGCLWPFQVLKKSILKPCILFYSIMVRLAPEGILGPIYTCHFMCMIAV